MASYLCHNYYCDQPEIINHHVRARTRNIENHVIGNYKYQVKFYNY
jgi:hypothetical protein